MVLLSLVFGRTLENLIVIGLLSGARTNQARY